MEPPIAGLTAVTIDCRNPAPMIAFYAGAFGAAVSHEDDTGAWIHLPGGPLLLVRRLDDYAPPTWPGGDLQLHLELSVADLDAAEARLVALGAVVPAFQPHRAEATSSCSTRGATRSA